MRIMRSIASAPRAASTRLSSPAASTAARSTPGMPSMCSWTSSDSLVHCRKIFGMTTNGSSGEIRGEPLDVVRLDREIELPLQRAGELTRQFRSAGSAAHRAFPTRSTERDVERRRRSASTFGADPRATNLQHDRRAVLQAGAMHLRNRRGALGRGVRARLNASNGERPSVRVKFRQQARRTEPAARRCAASRTPRSMRREKIDARRQQLAELDERRPELLEREADALGRTRERATRPSQPQ